MDNLYICPICKQKLEKTTKTYGCLNNHNFDIAKEGYLNLLLVDQKSSKMPGDTEDMLKSRREFLEQGFYDNLYKNITQNINPDRKGKLVNILDVGCGEGYHLNSIIAELNAKDTTTNTYGMDISKYAIQLAAKKYKNISFSVANINYPLPYSDQAFDIVLNIFAPRNPEEFKRVIKNDGLLIVVIPGVNHLTNLRTELGYGITYEEKQKEVINVFNEFFELKNKVTCEYNIGLSSKNAQLLAKMSPIFWQIDQSNIEQLPEIQKETVHFEILAFAP